MRFGWWSLKGGGVERNTWKHGQNCTALWALQWAAGRQRCPAFTPPATAIASTASSRPGMASTSLQHQRSGVHDKHAASSSRPRPVPFRLRLSAFILIIMLSDPSDRLSDFGIAFQSTHPDDGQTALHRGGSVSSDLCSVSKPTPKRLENATADSRLWWGDAQVLRKNCAD